MKKEPIHQNLNTSFVNVGALVRYLRSLQFVGSVRVEFASYEADIVFTASQMIRAREFDHINGRITHGDQALKRILVRAREPHGRIHVYRAVEGYAGKDDGSTFIDKSILTSARKMAASTGGTALAEASPEVIMDTRDGENALVLGALSEVLRAIDETLTKGNLSFSAAFRVACDAIAPKYEFMGTEQRALVYRDGEIVLHAQAEADAIVSAVFAALRPIFKRLRSERKYGPLLDILTDRLRELTVERREEFVRLSLITHIEELIEDEAL